MKSVHTSVRRGMHRTPGLRLNTSIFVVQSARRFWETGISKRDPCDHSPEPGMEMRNFRLSSASIASARPGRA